MPFGPLQVPRRTVHIIAFQRRGGADQPCERVLGGVRQRFDRKLLCAPALTLPIKNPGLPPPRRFYSFLEQFTATTLARSHF